MIRDTKMAERMAGTVAKLEEMPKTKNRCSQEIQEIWERAMLADDAAVNREEPDVSLWLKAKRTWGELFEYMNDLLIYIADDQKYHDLFNYVADMMADVTEWEYSCAVRMYEIHVRWDEER
jgi:hypothetical protein